MDEQHPEYICQRCGGRNPVWNVDSDRYNMAVNRSEIVCPTCFIIAHEKATGMSTVWQLNPMVPFKWIEDEGRETPFMNWGPNFYRDLTCLMSEETKLYNCIICQKKIHRGDSDCVCSVFRVETFEYASLCLSCATVFDTLNENEYIKTVLKHLLNKEYWKGAGPVIDF